MSDGDDYSDWDAHDNYYDPDQFGPPIIDDSDADDFETWRDRAVNESKIEEEHSITKEKLEEHIHNTATSGRKLKALTELIDFSTLPVEMRFHGICFTLSNDWIEGAKLFLWYVSTDTNFKFYLSQKKETTTYNFKSSSNFLTNLMNLAVEKGEDSVLKLLLSEGANVHLKLKGPFKSIHIAVQRQHVQSVKCLLIHGADVNSQYPINTNLYQGSTLLHRAVEKGNMSIVKLLMDFGVDINAVRSDGSTALKIAASRGFLEITNAMIQEGADINLAPVRSMTNEERKKLKKEEHRLLQQYGIEGSQSFYYFQMKPEIILEERTSLLSAIQNRQEKMVSFLLENGADINTEGWEGNTALQLAVQSSCSQIVLNVLNYSPKLVETNKQALYSAIQSMGTKDDHVILQKLLEFGFTLDSTDKNNPDLLRYAVRGNFLEVVAQILEFGANPNESSYKWNGFNQSPLHIAVIRGNKAMVKVLLNFGASPNSKDQDGNIPLLYATILSESEIARILLEKGADSSNDILPMIFAAANCDVELVRLFCERGYKVNERILYQQRLDRSLRAFNKVRIGRKLSSNDQYECFMDFLPKAVGEQSALDHYHQNNFYNSYEVTPLSIAARANHFDTVKLLLERGADVHSQDKNGITVLHEAAQGSNIETVKVLLKFGAKINAESSKGTPLCLAVATQRWEVVEFLLKRGAINGEQGKQKCIFNETVKSSAPDIIVKLLVERNFSCDHWDFESTLTHLIKQRKIELVKLLIDYKANLSSVKIQEMLPTCISTAIEKNLEAETNYLLDYSSYKFESTEGLKKPFLISIKVGNMQIVTKMLGLGINANVAERWSTFDARLNSGSNFDIYCINKYTALHIAAREGHVDIVKKLLDHGASVNSKDERGRSPIFDACENGHFEIVKLLMKHEYYSECKTGLGKAIFDSTDKKRKTPLFKASKNGHIEIVKYLLKQGGAAEIRTVHGETPLSIAARNGHLNIVKVLLKNGAIINTIDNWRKSPLHKAVRKRYYEIVKFLIENGANTEIRDYDKKTPLMLAVQNNFLKISEELLKSGAEVNCLNSRKESSIHIAVERNLSEMVHLLLEHGANLDLQDSQLETPLILSVKRRKTEDYQKGEVISIESREKEKIFETLLMFGANLNLQDCHGKAALHHAAGGFNNKMIRLLLDWGANVELKDREGKTPLFSAVEHGYGNKAPQSVETLLAAGADINTTDANGTSLIVSTLSICDSTSCLKLLLEFDAKLDNQQAMKKFEKISVWSRTYYNIKIVIHHAIKMIAVNKHDEIGALTILADKYVGETEVFRDECNLEVHQMKNEYIGNTTITFFEILTKNFRQLASLVKKEEIVQNLRANEFEDKFPIYASLLKIRLQMGEIRNNLMKKSVKLCWYLFQHYPALPIELVERVLDYVSNVDLRMIIVTCERIRASSLGTLPQCSSLEELNLFDA